MSVAHFSSAPSDLREICNAFWAVDTARDGARETSFTQINIPRRTHCLLPMGCPWGAGAWLMGGGGGCSQGGGIPFGLGGMGGPPMLGMGGG